MSQTASPTARLVLPRLSLSQCVRAMLVRDTRGTSLDEAQRLSFFPCSPWCSITWVLHGQVELFEHPPGAASMGSRTAFPDSIVFTGPWARPVATSSAGPVYLIKLLFLPDALEALTGIAPGDWLNRSAAAQEVLNAEWWRWCEAVRAAPGDAERLALIECTLDDWWRRQRPPAVAGWRHLDDWSQGLALRAATSALGRSVRQMERRIKGWTGQTLRELRGMAKSERAFFDAFESPQDAEFSWADIAQRAGYADQSHLCRQTRRLTGFSPEELRRGIAQDEAFWSYRVWGMGPSEGQQT